MSYTRDDVLKATEGLTGLTIPVHVEIEAKQVVLAQPEMRELLAGADVIAIGNCLCRETEGNCDQPLDVCIALDSASTERIEDRNWRTISIDEAIAVLEKTYECGLAHLADRRWDGAVNLVCSCCSCCCQPLNSVRQFSYRYGITESAFIASFDEAKCIGCGSCATRCMFSAFKLPEGANTADFHEDRCFGCGLCVGTCPGDAITLVRKTTLWALVQMRHPAAEPFLPRFKNDIGLGRIFHRYDGRREEQRYIDIERPLKQKKERVEEALKHNKLHLEVSRRRLAFALPITTSLKREAFTASIPTSVSTPPNPSLAVPTLRSTVTPAGEPT